MVYIGIDNGTSGSIGIVNTHIEFPEFFETPTYMQQDYTKKRKNLSRLIVEDFADIFKAYNKNEVKVFMERPLVNSRMFNTTCTALRCFEAQLIILERFNMPYMFVDSKEWQKVMLPKGVKGSKELKKASLDIGIRLFPQFKKEIQKQGDADGLLIAEWARITKR